MAGRREPSAAEKASAISQADANRASGSSAKAR